MAKKKSSSGKKAAKVSSKSSAKKAPAKKKAATSASTTTAKTKVAKKKTAKKAAVSKAAAKTTAKKSTAKKAPVKKKAAPEATPSTPKKKTTSTRKKASAASVKSASATTAKVVPKIKIVNKKEKELKSLDVFTKRELAKFRSLLLELRDRIVDEITFLSGDSLNRNARDSSGDLSNYSLHMADQGTDNFDREFALNLISSEQDVLYEIDEAIRRIDNNTYGICEISGKAISKERLKVLPYARNSVLAQSELERGRSRFRPFGPTLSHG